MAEIDYASNAKANTALWLAGGALGAMGLGALNNNCGCNNGGLLGNLFGGNNCCNSCNNGQRDAFLMQSFGLLQSENATLKAQNATLVAENYSDKVAKETYMQSLADNNRLESRFNEQLSVVTSNLNALNDYAHNQAIAQARTEERLNCCCEKQELQNQNLVLKINETAQALNGKIDVLQANNNGQFNVLDSTISCINRDVRELTQRVNCLTREVIPIDNVCPTPMPAANSWTAPTGTTPSSIGVVTNTSGGCRKAA